MVFSDQHNVMNVYGGLLLYYHGTVAKENRRHLIGKYSSVFIGSSWLISVTSCIYLPVYSWSPAYRVHLTCFRCDPSLFNGSSFQKSCVSSRKESLGPGGPAVWVSMVDPRWRRQSECAGHRAAADDDGDTWYTWRVTRLDDLTMSTMWRWRIRQRQLVSFMILLLFYYYYFIIIIVIIITPVVVAMFVVVTVVVVVIVTVVKLILLLHPVFVCESTSSEPFGICVVPRCLQKKNLCRSLVRKLPI